MKIQKHLTLRWVLGSRTKSSDENHLEMTKITWKSPGNEKEGKKKNNNNKNSPSMQVLELRLNLLVSDALLRCRGGADGVDLAIVLVMLIMVMMITLRMIMAMMMALMTTMLRISKIMMMMEMVKMMLRMLTTMMAPTMVVQSVHVLAEAKATKAEMVRIRVLMFLKS